MKLSLFADDLNLTSKSPEKLHQKLLDIINILGKVAGYKINLPIAVPFLYTNNKQTEKTTGK
jgi:hypothetical protein